MLGCKYQSSMPSSFREEEFWSWSALFLCSILWTPPPRHHMNKLGRDPQGDATYQISKLYAFQYQRRIKNFEVCCLCFYVPTFGPPPPGWVSLDPRGIICTNLVEVHLEMLNTKYQSSRPSTFREVLCSYGPTCNPRAGPILSLGA